MTISKENEQDTRSQDRSRSPRGKEIQKEDLLDGHNAAKIFHGNTKTGYTYDDLIVLPGHIDFDVKSVTLDSRFTRQISLRVPLVSSPMDTVTEAKMAIAIALEGGIGVIHCNLAPEEQAAEVKMVKKYKNGFITEPCCITPTMGVSELLTLGKQKGFTGFPVTEDGRMGSKLLGLVTKRDTDFVVDKERMRVADIMTPLKGLTTADEGVDLLAANKILRDSKKGKLPIVSEEKRLLALVARTDLKKNADFPLATKDRNKSLMVAAAVGTRPSDRDRVRLLVASGVDAIVIDSSQGDSMFQHEMIK
jgi:IMP dehydrogenase